VHSLPSSRILLRRRGIYENAARILTNNCNPFTLLTVPGYTPPYSSDLSMWIITVIRAVHARSGSSRIG
jgi:hypothetical protein